jgi:DNA-binding transcriptional MocR family regulator
MRLNFSFPSVAQIEEGMARLGRVFDARRRRVRAA